MKHNLALLIIIFKMGACFAQANHSFVDTIYYIGGKVKSLEFGKDVQRDSLIIYNDDGNLNSKIIYANYVAKDFLRFSYNRNGSLQTKEQYQGGRLNGLYEVYDDSGRI